eukprot:CAMPEP_0172864688 /NCGR_PEP_ID=MMETSP1075-20121228/80982_1 /TAXON_ID=2916 /ORGANISM="Ceratium fusus, Strain PA161109" /LENGTH=49 /DNA_ID= /DNA_START= /DNA_END= /DNA_ORIENTATION=
MKRLPDEALAEHQSKEKYGKVLTMMNWDTDVSAMLQGLEKSGTGSDELE